MTDTATLPANEAPAKPDVKTVIDRADIKTGKDAERQLESRRNLHGE